jgi:hypothetical protein
MGEDNHDAARQIAIAFANELLRRDSYSHVYAFGISDNAITVRFDRIPLGSGVKFGDMLSFPPAGEECDCCHGSGRRNK